MPGRFSEEFRKLINVRGIDNHIPQDNGRFFKECHRGGEDIAEFFGPEAKLGNININYCSLGKGIASADHYHKLKKEVISVVEGKIVVIVQNPETGDFYYQEVGSEMKFNLPPGFSHALYPLEDSKILEIAYPKFDKIETEKDTRRLRDFGKSLVDLLPLGMRVSPKA